MFPPQGIAALLEEALVVYKGTTTSDGGASGATLVCLDLAAKADWDGNQIIITSGDYEGQARDINGTTNNVTGTVTPANAFSGVIVSGVSFVITGIRTVPAEVAELLADVGDASSSQLGSLYGILGDPANSFLTMIGYEGATSLAAKLTAARAGYLANINNVNLATIADISTLTATEIAYLDADISSRAVAGDAMALTAAERLVIQALVIDDTTPYHGANIDAKISEVVQQTCLTGHGADSIGKILYDIYNARVTATRAGYFDILNSDSKYILSTALTPPTVNSLTKFIASGGTGLGQPLPASTSLIDLLGDFTGPYDGAAQDDNVKASLDLAHTDLNTIAADTIYIADGALPASPTTNSLARFIASGGTALGTPLPASKSLYNILGTGYIHDSGDFTHSIRTHLRRGLAGATATTVLAEDKSILDAIGHNGSALVASGIGMELRRGAGTQIPDNKGIYDYLHYLTGNAYTRLGAPGGASISVDIAANLTAIGALNNITAANVRQSVCLTGDPASSIGKLLFDYLNAPVGSIPTTPTLQATWTDTKAGFLTGDAFVRLGAPVGASISVDVAAIKSEIGNATYGLSALEALVDDLESRLGTPAAGTVAGDVESIETKVGANDDAAGTTTLFARAKQIVDTYLADATIGLAAIEAFVDCLPATLHNITAASVMDVDISAYSGVGYAGTYLKTLYDDWLDDGRLDAILDAIKAETDTHPTLAEIEASSVLALKAHLVQGTGDIIPPDNTGLWDYLPFLDENISDAKTLTSTERDNIRKSVCLTGDTANSIGKILYEIYINRLTSTRAGYLDELAAANLPADIDTIKGLVDSAEAAGPYSYTDAGGEQTVKEDTTVTRRHIYLELSNRNMTETGTFKVYRKVDGTNYDLYTTQAVKVVAGSDRAWDCAFTTNQAWKVTYEEDVDEGAARNIPYNVITEVKE